jgi:hypothetical protein
LSKPEPAPPGPVPWAIGDLRRLTGIGQNT